MTPDTAMLLYLLWKCKNCFDCESPQRLYYGATARTKVNKIKLSSCDQFLYFKSGQLRYRYGTADRHTKIRIFLDTSVADLAVLITF